MNTPLQIVIVEDEPVIARELARLLTQLDAGISVVAVLNSVEEATDWFGKNSHAYQLIFMDIRLSDGLSFSIFKNVSLTRPVIFVTSYNDYALDAFKNNGIDYILKPFDEQEIGRALNKYRQLTGSLQQVPVIAIDSLLQQIGQFNKTYKRSFLVHYRNKLLPIETTGIAWFYTANEAVYAQTVDNSRYTIDQTMEQLIQQLNPEEFFRANRQFIVQRSFIKEVEFFFNGRLLVKINPEPPERILISKARVPEFKEWMNR
ncbi:LytTR family DNA-binding domain-containing protein [Mucilaginibacter sp. UR6-1]|uniref:LytR/AlgR family response regulator transcription factor n=1 Tax=Mucilaginibacter sp. UR6-1 TaxID=1435643 RepID=UPI001E3ED0FB|nr:LytTR family DNA-binding domain-containing protein [Mucilaginibacter sp. UR6-1]MCC8408310.1 LytTR family DNA-binding domain-containing protein [Mucilaginibacter sp. UR6-1]